jgi:hypothetical protein
MASQENRQEIHGNVGGGELSIPAACHENAYPLRDSFIAALSAAAGI